jgi:predicted transcriptional regulator of viral defense system
MRQDPRSRAIKVFQEHDGVLRTKQAIELGIHPRTLYFLRDEGVVTGLSRGVYRLASLPPLSQLDLVTVALRIPRAVVCLVSALSYHEVTSEIPHAVQIALPRRTKTPRLSFPPIHVFWFSGPALSEGIETEKVDGIEVNIYDLPKTVVDCFRFRNKVGLDVAIAALNEAVNRKGVRPAELLRYARLCRIESVILPYLEALQ